MANPWMNNYTTYKGSAPTVASQARGNSEYEYLNTTDQARAQQLYDQYGKGRGWIGMDQWKTLKAPAPAPVAATPMAAPEPVPNPVAVAAAEPIAANPTPTAAAPAPLPNVEQLLPTTQMSAPTTPVFSAGMQVGTPPPEAVVPQDKMRPGFSQLAQATSTQPQFNFDWGGAQNFVNQNTNVGGVMSYAPTPQNDAIYQYQLDEGNRALAALNAARGLNNSGAQQESQRRLQAQLLADQASRAVDVGKADQSNAAYLSGQKLSSVGNMLDAAVSKYGQDINYAQVGQNANADWMMNQQKEADRLYNIKRDEADRLITKENQNITKYGQGLDFISNLNVLGQGANASTNIADLYKTYGPQIMQYLSQVR